MNWILAHFVDAELNSLLILRLWSLKFLEICDFGVKVDSSLWELQMLKRGVLRTIRRSWKGGLHSRTYPRPIFQWVLPPPPPSTHIVCIQNEVSAVTVARRRWQWNSTCYYIGLYCVSQKERVRGNQRPYLKMRPLYLHFCFWFNMSTTLGCLCKNLLWITQMVLKMWLWKWTQRILRI